MTVALTVAGGNAWLPSTVCQPQWEAAQGVRHG